MGEVFSCKGIQIAVDFFLKRGHKVKAMLPRFRRGNSDKKCPSYLPEILDTLDKEGHLTYTPSRFVDNKLIIPYGEYFKPFF
jgi:ribonuclease ZC3H12